MPGTEPYEPDRGLGAKLHRRLVQWRYAAPVNIRPARPILTISFDDAPTSSVRTAAPILDRHGVRACYYIASSLIDTDTVMGRIAGRDDIRAAYNAGHEIGSHTHSHIDCARTPASEVQNDINRNLSELNDILKGAPVESFAFPFGETSFVVKSAIESQFSSLRGVLPGPNRGLCDRAQLRAFELDGSTTRLARLLRAMTLATETPAWLIMFTHDVCDDHSGFGITPADLETIISQAKALDFEIKTPAETVRYLNLGAHS